MKIKHEGKEFQFNNMRKLYNFMSRLENATIQVENDIKTEKKTLYRIDSLVVDKHGLSYLQDQVDNCWDCGSKCDCEESYYLIRIYLRARCNSIRSKCDSNCNPLYCKKYLKSIKVHDLDTVDSIQIIEDNIDILNDMMTIINSFIRNDLSEELESLMRDYGD